MQNALKNEQHSAKIISWLQWNNSNLVEHAILINRLLSVRPSIRLYLGVKLLGSKIVKKSELISLKTKLLAIKNTLVLL